MSGLIDISKMKRCEVLAALYNKSRPLGFGRMHYDPKPMTAAEAQVVLDGIEGGFVYFDYLKGRVMKVRLDEDLLNPRLYDRDNGEGAAAMALLPLMGQ